MAKKIRTLTITLAGYYAGRFDRLANMPITVTANRIELPLALQPVFLQGEALLRLSFFEFIEKHFSMKPEQVMHYYGLLADRQGNREHIQEVVERIGLHKLIKIRQESERYDYKLLCYTLYCLLLADLHFRRETALYRLATGGVFRHFFAGLFPKKDRIKNLSLFKQQISDRLKEKWGIRPKLRESFKVEEDSVNFLLTALCKGCEAVELCRLTGKRLQPTRIKAYKDTLKVLENGTLTLPSLQKMP